MPGEDQEDFGCGGGENYEAMRQFDNGLTHSNKESLTEYAQSIYFPVLSL